MVKRSTTFRSRHRAAGSSTSRPARAVGVLLPAGVLSAAWTISLVSSSFSAVPVGAGPEQSPTPSGDDLVSSQTVEVPANYSVPLSATEERPGATSHRVEGIASSNDIPAVAMNAYRRASTVMAASRDSCALPWQLVAAVARVESDHGRAGGSTLGADGVARPGIYGPPLDGTDNTLEILDTDAGQYDRDRVHDRAVGPMQFIPTTWSIVGVDADGDGVRNPQDLDDAALAAGVYLCSGSSDLSTVAGQRAAVHRYNHSWEYVDLVLSIADKYVAQQDSVGTTVAASPVTIRPVRPNSAVTTARGTGSDTSVATQGPAATESAGHTTTSPKKDRPSPAHTKPAPTGPSKDKQRNPVETVLDELPVKTVLTEAQARARCLASGLLSLDLAALRTCIDGLLKR